MKRLIGFLARVLVPVFMLFIMLAVVAVKVAYAQSGEPEPPGIDQLVQSIDRKSVV